MAATSTGVERKSVEAFPEDQKPCARRLASHSRKTIEAGGENKPTRGGKDNNPT